VARFYADENVPFQVVAELRRLGHDVLTPLDAGQANAAVQDSDVLSFAAAQQRILVSLNRRDFLKLHRHRAQPHCGIVVCTYDLDFAGQAKRVSNAVAGVGDTLDWVIRVNRLD
jgi:predicted nuclease of predicted toxin-antitoxin system